VDLQPLHRKRLPFEINDKRRSGTAVESEFITPL
jgi:hypothetical protein